MGSSIPGRPCGRAALAFCLVAACHGNDPVAVSQTPADDSGPSDAGLTDGSADGPIGDASLPDAEDAPAPDAPLAPVTLGVVPLPFVGEGGTPGPSEQTLAYLETLAAGARGTTLIRRWDELAAPLTSPVETAFAGLETAASLYARQRRQLLFCLSIVDRALPVLPEGASADWSAPENRAAIDDLIDQLFATFGEELRYFVIGKEVDRWLALANRAERSGFVDFVSGTLSYVRDHPRRPAALEVGVAASAQGWTEGTAGLAELRPAIDVVVATYFPLTEEFEARSPSSAGPDIELLLEALTSESEPPLPLVLQEVGYPSSEVVGSSEALQQLFFEGFFQALQSRRARIPFANVFALNEQAEAACALDAESFGATGDERAIAAWCSLGLRDRDGLDRPAWETVSDGLAHFATP